MIILPVNLIEQNVPPSQNPPGDEAFHRGSILLAKTIILALGTILGGYIGHRNVNENKYRGLAIGAFQGGCVALSVISILFYKKNPVASSDDSPLEDFQVPEDGSQSFADLPIVDELMSDLEKRQGSTGEINYSEQAEKDTTPHHLAAGIGSLDEVFPGKTIWHVRDGRRCKRRTHFVRRE